MDPSLALLIGAGILIIGFIADIVHEKFGIPDILALIFLGALFGPILHVLPREPLMSLAPYFAALTLAIVLFESGINFPLSRVFSETPRAILYAFLGVALSALFTVLIFTGIFSWSIIESALLGVMVGGTSSAVIIPMVSRMKISSFAKNMLSIESVITDGIVIVIVMLLLRVIILPESAVAPEMISREIVGALVISGIIGVASAFFISKLLLYIRERPYGDVLILGLVILIYAASEQVGGSGALTTFLLGITLRNIALFSSWKTAFRRVSKAPSVSLEERSEDTLPSLRWYSKKFYAQLSFLMRTYFFAFLGMIFYVPDAAAFIMGLLLTVVLIFARVFSTIVSCVKATISRIDEFSMIFLCGRGLAAAVLASVLATYNLAFAELVEQLATQVIIYTSIISAVTAYAIGSPRFRKIFS
ncbi:MAG TPA: hypothetical protein ENG21_00120 [Nitrososphaeria archaeon]|nr:hypothetical protein [Nitrososphaeria archaeon]